MLRGKGIYKSYGKLEVLKGVDIEISPGEMVSLVGASGAGKSTLLQILGTLDFPSSGEVYFEGELLNRLRDGEKADFRNRELGFVFQFHHLLPEFNAWENVALPGLIARKEKKAVEARARELLDYFGLAERMDHRPSELSGGEQQRVAVARALINQPRLLMADEPTGNLDSVNSDNLYELFRNLCKDLKVGILITTHNEKLASSADRELRMVDGIII